MSSAQRQKAKDLMAVALDERNSSEKERITAGFTALKMISKYGLLDSPLDGILDGANEDVMAAKNVVETLTGTDFVNSVKRVARAVTGGRGGGDRGGGRRTRR